MSEDTVIELRDEVFEAQVEKSDKPVLVDFWAPWCGPCKAIAPVVSEISKEFEGRVKVGKVNVDENQQTSIKFGIRSIPTLLVFKNGEIVNQIIGAVAKSEIERALNEAL